MISTLAGSAVRGFTVLFVVALIAETAVRLWLSSRQIAAVRAHRDRVPELFSGRIELAEQQRAADYTVARARATRWSTAFEALIKLALTLGGGLAAMQLLVGRAHWLEPWQGTLLVLGVLFILQLVGLPFAVWRTFRIEARFGFNRMTPKLFALDVLKQWLLGFAIGAPLALATLALMGRGGGVVVGMGVARLACRQPDARMGRPALHRAAVQSFLAARRRGPARARGSVARALWLYGRRRGVRDGRIAPLGARQRLFYGHRP
jgi:hypothetical protein